ncbi:MAG: cyanoexosortase A system-associated protein [Tolypothrix sp. Co-bin9]|nr:cyanoexosortase A system-associated protein [Tolypothrix sp. Co-bin9]
MFIWKQFRIPLLALTFSSVLLVLGKVILLPSPEKGTLTPFVFPEAVPLAQWQLKATSPLPEPTEEHPELIAQKHYQYIQNDLPLNIEMRYVTDGNLRELMRKYTSISSSAVVRQHQKVGYYGLLVDRQRAYLSACINPQGGSTFTPQQLNGKQYLYEGNWERILAWLLSQQSLPDQRCLWAHLSIPLQSSSPETAYKKLENAWFSWHQWWQRHFPKL